MDQVFQKMAANFTLFQFPKEYPGPTGQDGNRFTACRKRRSKIPDMALGTAILIGTGDDKYNTYFPYLPIPL